MAFFDLFRTFAESEVGLLTLFRARQRLRVTNSAGLIASAEATVVVERARRSRCCAFSHSRAIARGTAIADAGPGTRSRPPSCSDCLIQYERRRQERRQWPNTELHSSSRRKRYRRV